MDGITLMGFKILALFIRQDNHITNKNNHRNLNTHNAFEAMSNNFEQQTCILVLDPLYKSYICIYTFTNSI